MPSSHDKDIVCPHCSLVNAAHHMRQSHAINVFFKEVFSQCELYAQSKPGAAPYGFNFWIEPDLASKLCNTLATKSMLSTAVSFQELAAHQLSERILSLFFAWIVSSSSLGYSTFRYN